MKNIAFLAIVSATLATIPARAQLQTLVDSSTVINVASNSYAVIENAQTYNSAPLQITMHGVTFSIDVGEDSVSGFTFTGPATIQFANTPNPTFATISVAPLRKAVGTNIQTLVVDPANQTSATVTVPANSYAVINSGDTLSSATLSVTVQGTLFTYALQDVSVKNLTFAGPATVQLQGDAYGPSFTTVEVMPLKKTSKTQIQTLVVDPTNTISSTLNVGANRYALIRTVETEDGTLTSSVNGTALNFTDLQDESVAGFKFAGPASFQLQGNAYTPSFVTIETGPLKK
jgi:hypothetical protein